VSESAKQQQAWRAEVAGAQDWDRGRDRGYGVTNPLTSDRIDAGDPKLDLRRRGSRDMADILCARAEWLPARDAAMVRLVYADGKSLVEIGRITGASVRSIRRRMRRIVARTLSPEFILVAQERERWTRTRRSVGEACFLKGMAIREAVSHLGLSMHTVRTHRGAIIAIASQRAQSAGRAGAARSGPGRAGLGAA